MQPSKKEIENYYNGFGKKNLVTGLNTRHRIIIKNLKKLGLKNNSNILEIGCGNGMLSSEIIKLIPNGQFLGCDISPESIEIAQNLNKGNKAVFVVSDMSNFESELTFDIIVFPDVLEHIPTEQHIELFRRIALVCHENSQILINIPHPLTQDYYRINQPEVLQIIDQSLSMNDMLNSVYPHGFFVDSITPYSIHTTENNYISIALNRKTRINSIAKKSRLMKIFQNIQARISWL
jgi:cyclopropane fatty-acyl-phospholipid synthase-like methyltransferase